MTAEPAWKTKWPRNGDLKTWLRAMIQKCEAIPDNGKAAEKAHLPIEHLAELGCIPEAIRNVNRFLRRLPRQEVLATVRMAELGARISLDSGDLGRMERYLAIAESTEPFNTRKCDRGFSLNSVREFRADHGLLDPANAIDEEQRFTARFECAGRQYRRAIAADERESAGVAVREMETIADEVDEDWKRQSYLQRVIACYAELKDARAVKRCLRGMDQDDRHEILDAAMLLSLGMKAKAIARAKQDIAHELDELCEMTNPNIHFPVASITRSVEFLAANGAKGEARRCLRRVLKEMPTWPLIQSGWTTSAVYHSLAQVTAMIDGPDAAEDLLVHAMADARPAKRGGFRQGAIDATLDLRADLGRLDQAIDDARRLRSPTQRRHMLGTLLAKARRWTELRTVLSEVQSPEEAADLAWSIKFELSGGAAR